MLVLIERKEDLLMPNKRGFRVKNSNRDKDHFIMTKEANLLKGTHNPNYRTTKYKK